MGLSCPLWLVSMMPPPNTKLTLKYTLDNKYRKIHNIIITLYNLFHEINLVIFKNYPTNKY